MTEQINDGGSAFPIPDQRHAGGLDGSYGMSLRDYFAAKALQGMIAGNSATGPTFEDDAATAYQWADAMLAEREK